MARVRVDVSASEPVMNWADVHGPARAVLYGLIRVNEPELSQQLHDVGWQGSPLRPLGISPPLFLGAAPRHGAYTTSGTGSVWFGSPVPEIAAAILQGLAAQSEIRWGSVTLNVQGKELEIGPDYRSGQADLVSVSPVLVKKESRFLLPGDRDYAERLTHNLRHKADVLGLPNEVDIDVLDSGPRRVFDVAGAKRVGANARLRVSADPRLLGALYEWGLGLNCVQGFGWLQ